MRIKEKWYENLDDKELEYLYKNDENLGDVPYFLDNRMIHLIDEHFKKDTKKIIPLGKLFLRAALVLSVLLIAAVSSIYFITGNIQKSYLTAEKINGNVHLLDKTSKIIKTGDQIKQNKTISIEKNSSGDFSFINNTKIKVTGSGRINLKKIMHNKKDDIQIIYLDYGKIDCDVAALKNKSFFEIETDNIIVGVTGTKFSVEKQNSFLKIVVYEGKIYTKIKSEEIENSLKIIKKHDSQTYIKIKQSIEEKIYLDKNYQLLLTDDEIKKMTSSIIKNNMELSSTLESYKKNKITKEQLNEKIRSSEFQIESIKKTITEKITLKTEDKITNSNTVENKKDENENTEKEIMISKLKSFPEIPISEKSSYFSNDKNNIYIANDADKAVYSINPDTLKINWIFRDSKITKITNPAILYKNQIIITIPENIFILNKSGKIIKTENITNGPIYPSSPVHYKPYLIIPGSEKVYRYANGSISVMEEIPASLGQIYLQYFPNSLFCVYSNQKLIKQISLKIMEPAYESDKLDNRIMMSPLLLGKYLYIADIKNTFYRISYEKNKITKINLDSGVISNIVYDSGFLYFIDNSGWLNKIYITNFNKAVKILQVDKNPDREIYFSKKIIKYDNSLFFCSNDGKLLHYNTETKQPNLITVNNNNSPLAGTPVKINNKLYFFDTSSTLYSMEYK